MMVLTCEEREDGESCEEVTYWRTAVESSGVTGVLSSLCSDFSRLRVCLLNSSGWREGRKEGRREGKRGERSHLLPLHSSHLAPLHSSHRHPLPLHSSHWHPLPPSLIPPGTKGCDDSPRQSVMERVSVELPHQRNSCLAHSN